MRTVKKEPPQAIEALLSRLNQTPSGPRQMRQNPGEEGIKRLVLSDVLRQEAQARFPGDKIGEMKFTRGVMQMLGQGMSEEDIYRSLQDGTFDEKVAANDPFARFNR
jgi:hypothetical protein|tara:strand:- start:3166 stop:3486 length:321 start_codon:yes stop_codon:yes gene_type:complete